MKKILEKNLIKEKFANFFFQNTKKSKKLEKFNQLTHN